MVSLCFSGPTCRTHFTPWHLTLQLNQEQFSAHNSILSVVCGWPFFLVSVNSKEKNTDEKSWFCHKYRIIQKDHRKCLLRACNFSNEVFIDSTRKFSRHIDLYWSWAGPTQTPTLSKDVHTLQHFWNKLWGWSESAVSVTQLTSAWGIQWEYIQCESSNAFPAAHLQLCPSPLNNRAGSWCPDLWLSGISEK